MIDPKEDSERVGSQISLARARRAERLAELKAGPKPQPQAEEGVLSALPSMPQTPPPAALAETHSLVSTSTPALPPADPEAAFRRARIGVVAVIVLVLFWLWIRQRAAAPK